MTRDSVPVDVGSNPGRGEIWGFVFFYHFDSRNVIVSSKFLIK